jgi:glycosyltransferase involved in cell wall biosynthesis
VHIGLIIYGPLETLTGGYVYDRHLVAFLQRRGHKVEVLSWPERAYGRRLADNFSSGRLRPLIAKSFDILLQDELCHPSLFWLNRRLRRYRRYPIVTIVHHLLCEEPRAGWQNSLYRLIEKHYLASVDGFVFNSFTTRRAVARLVDSGRPNIVAHPAGDRLGSCRSPAMLKERSTRPGPLQLLFLGHVIPRKGLLPMLEDLMTLPPDRWELTVVGSLTTAPDYVRRLQAVARAGRISERIQWLGVCPDEQLVHCLARSHLLFMPYAYEGFGIVFLEGMAFGLPAVGYRLGAAKEIIRHGVNGFLVEPNGGNFLATLIGTLHADRNQLLQLSLAALRRFRQQPTWDDAMRGIESFLNSMVSGWPTPFSQSAMRL